jgi:Flp pilus assembly protein TadG
MVILGVAIGAVTVVAERVRLADAAREAARAAARGDPAAGRRLALGDAPGARVVVSTGGGAVTAVATKDVHPLGGWLPSITVSERGAAAVEPTVAPP